MHVANWKEPMACVLSGFRSCGKFYTSHSLLLHYLIWELIVLALYKQKIVNEKTVTFPFNGSMRLMTTMWPIETLLSVFSSPAPVYTWKSQTYPELASAHTHTFIPNLVGFLGINWKKRDASPSASHRFINADVAWQLVIFSENCCKMIDKGTNLVKDVIAFFTFFFFCLAESSKCK